MARMKNERGLALAMVIMAALLAAIAAYAMLLAATSQATQGRFTVDHARTRYAAEAALVWAQQQLLADPTWSSAQGADVTIDGVSVDIIIPSCPTGSPTPPCPSRRLTAQVVY